MAKVYLEYTIYRGEDEEEEIELEIHGYCTPYIPAKLSGHPDTWAPPEGGDSEIEEILLDGEPWDGHLTKSEERDIEEALIEKLQQDEEDAEMDAAADKYDSMMDDYMDGPEADYIYDPF